MFGISVMRTRIAREMFEREEDTPLPGYRLRCFILLSPFSLRVKCITWL